MCTCAGWRACHYVTVSNHKSSKKIIIVVFIYFTMKYPKWSSPYFVRKLLVQAWNLWIYITQWTRNVYFFILSITFDQIILIIVIDCLSVNKQLRLKHLATETNLKMTHFPYLTHESTMMQGRHEMGNTKMKTNQLTCEQSVISWP